MKRKLFILIAAVLLVLTCAGCKDKNSGDAVLKDKTELEAEAKKEITAENMDAELKKLEAEVQQDTAAE